MKLLIASDHAGFAMKQKIKSLASDIEWIDLGPESEDRVDYPDYADKVCKKIISEGGQGVLICGSGQGMAMRANKYKEIRAALCWSEEISKLAKAHNDANVLCLAGRFLPPEEAKKILDAFLKTEFEGGRHTARVEKVST
jgi:ribose 5-phosphate isomerase B